MAEKVVFREDDLSVGDLEDFEEITGRPLDEALGGVEGGNVRIDAKTLKAIVYIMKRREDPNFTLEQARDVKVSELVLDQRPTKAVRAGQKKKPASKKK